jgi:chromosome partitioning protein
MRTWAYVSEKGGSGKSTLCSHLAAYAEQQDEVVCVLDLDPNASAVLWSQVRGTKEPMVLAAAPEKLGELIAAADTLGVTLVMIDTPSKIDHAALAAIHAADLIIAPTRASLFDLGALADTVRLLRTAGRLEAAVAVINCVPSEKDKEAATVGQATAALERMGLAIAPAHVCERPPFEKAIGEGKGVTEKFPKSPAAAEIRKLWDVLATAATQASKTTKPAKTTKGKARAS